MRALRLWPLIVGLLLVAAFCSLELRGVGSARAGFTLVGLVDCGLTSGRACSIGDTLVLVSNDSGTSTRYLIDLSWLDPDDLDRIDQDAELSVEVERLPDGRLMATSLANVSDRSGTSNPGLVGARASKPVGTDDDDRSIRPTTQTMQTTQTTQTTTTLTPPTTLTFDVPGTYAWTVPAGVSQATFELFGAHGGPGGGGFGSTGGLGGQARLTVTVSRGQVYQVNVGGAGSGPARAPGARAVGAVAPPTCAPAGSPSQSGSSSPVVAAGAEAAVLVAPPSPPAARAAAEAGARRRLGRKARPASPPGAVALAAAEAEAAISSQAA